MLLMAGRGGSEISEAKRGLLQGRLINSTKLKEIRNRKIGMLSQLEYALFDYEACYREHHTLGQRELTTFSHGELPSDDDAAALGRMYASTPFYGRP